jgi:hypothetical protein
VRLGTCFKYLDKPVKSITKYDTRRDPFAWLRISLFNVKGGPRFLDESGFSNLDHKEFNAL